MLKKMYFLLILSTYVLFSAISFGFSSADGVGKIKILRAPVSINRKGKEIKVGSFGTEIKNDDLIITGLKGRAQVTLLSGDVILVAPNSRMKLNQKKEGGVSGITKYVANIFGKIRSRIRKSKKRRFSVRTVNATIGVKGTDFIVEYKDQKTTVGTIEGLVEMGSKVTNDKIDIPPGKMSSVPVNGEVMPLSAIAGTLLSGVEIAGAKMDNEEISGEKIKQ